MKEYNVIHRGYHGEGDDNINNRLKTPQHLLNVDENTAKKHLEKWKEHYLKMQLEGLRDLKIISSTEVMIEVMLDNDERKIFTYTVEKNR